MKICISSGHGKFVDGASCYINEVEQARRVTEETAENFRILGHEVLVFHDDTSTTQQQNLDTIIGWHNSHDARQLDISIHFNAYVETDGARGTEVLFLTQEELAGKVSAAIAESGELINRGAHYRGDLAFLNGTTAPAILCEICFVDAKLDVEAYQKNFAAICQAIAVSAGGLTSPSVLVHFSGTCSWFGGPSDMGVAVDEPLAFVYEYETHPWLFLDKQPEGTTGLARRLDADGVYYVACRWDYSVTSKEMLRDHTQLALVRANGRMRLAYPADWGPHEEKTGRAADLSPALMEALGIMTDEYVDVYYPIPESRGG
jgi:N-acetylmuramoyl-L-alanine amidase